MINLSEPILQLQLDYWSLPLQAATKIDVQGSFTSTVLNLQTLKTLRAFRLDRQDIMVLAGVEKGQEMGNAGWWY
jgi:hypothetical protein